MEVELLLKKRRRSEGVRSKKRRNRRSREDIPVGYREENRGGNLVGRAGKKAGTTWKRKKINIKKRKRFKGGEGRVIYRAFGGTDILERNQLRRLALQGFYQIAGKLKGGMSIRKKKCVGNRTYTTRKGGTSMVSHSGERKNPP